MTVTATPIFPQGIVNSIVTIVNATGTSAISLVAAGSNGTKIENINMTSTDNASAYTVNLFAYISATTYQIGCINLLINSGNVDTIPSINFLTSPQLPNLPKDSNGNPYIYLANGTSLYVSVGSTVTSGKTLTFFAQGGNF